VTRPVLCGLALWALAGCQTYLPRPLDGEVHRAEWAARSPGSESVREYAARIGVAPPSSAADGLALADAELVALTFNPELRSARARAAVALANSENAGRWDDPSLSFDVMRVTENIDDPWVIGGMVGFTIPLSGRLPVEKALASAEHELELRRVAETEWSTLAQFRSTWAEWSATRLRAELVRDLLARVESIIDVVDRLEAAQSINRLEGRLFRMELASRRSELLLLDSQAEQLELQLKSMMGLVPDAPLAMLPQLACDTPVPATEEITLVEQRNPSLAVHRAAYEVAEQHLHLAIRRQYPDLQIGPAYERDEGQNKVGLGGGLVLPLLNANRQGIAVAETERDASRTEYEVAIERAVSLYARSTRQYAGVAAARSAIEQDLLPLAEAQIADERRLTELGEFNVLLSMESVVRSHETKVQLIQARLAEANAAFRVLELLGPEPRQSTSEDRS
jgi:outer membrane protein, heavy metal efflux system